MDFREAAKVLGRDYEDRGYSWELIHDGKHPKLWIKSGKKRKWALMSSTANYDEGGALARKRQDIERDVIPHLPKPEIKVKTKVDPNGAQLEIEEVSKFVPGPNDITNPAKVYPIKIFLSGNGVFTVTIPRMLITEGYPEAKVFKTQEGHLALDFVSEGKGKPSSTTRGADIFAYRFARKAVPFDYAASTPAGYKAPRLTARFRGDRLVTDTPIAQEILQGARDLSKSKYSLADGSDLRDMMNDWLKWAFEEGHEPAVFFENNQIRIDIMERISKTL
jgi:hypothetical protein